MHITTFSLNIVIVRLTRIMNNLDKDHKIVILKSFFQDRKLVESFQKKSVKNIWLRDQLVLVKLLKVLYFLKIAQFLWGLFILWVSLTLFSEKMLLSNTCTCGFMPNLSKKSWTVSIVLGKKKKLNNFTFHYSHHSKLFQKEIGNGTN